MKHTARILPVCALLLGLYAHAAWAQGVAPAAGSDQTAQPARAEFAQPVRAESAQPEQAARAEPDTATAKKPNFVIVIADDATYTDLPLYGGQNVKTPQIDRLAEQGLTFNYAFLAEAMCNPCRTELYTGLYPAHSGSCWNHSAARPGTRSIVHHLGRLGYRVAIAGKTHVKPADSFPFERIGGLEPGCVSKTARYDDTKIREFFTRDPEQPFCMVIGLVVPHAPWTVGDPGHFPARKLQLPPHIADTQPTREDFARYLAEIEVLDQQVGHVLDALDELKLAEKTMLLFTSEQGGQWPGCKWTNWNTGVHTALVVRWPGKIAPGRRTDALVQYADILPTLVDAAGGDPTACGFDGSSFLPVLLGRSEKHRAYAYFMHNNIPEGPPYPVRGVTDGRYHYLRNLKPEAVYVEKHMMGQMQWHAYWPSWMFNTTFDQRTNQLVIRFLNRPAEELYDLRNDPFEMDNLADDPQYAEVKQRLAAELERWMHAQGDPGAPIDTAEQWQAARQGRHFPFPEPRKQVGD